MYCSGNWKHSSILLSFLSIEENFLLRWLLTNLKDSFRITKSKWHVVLWESFVCWKSMNFPTRLAKTLHQLTKVFDWIYYKITPAFQQFGKNIIQQALAYLFVIFLKIFVWRLERYLEIEIFYVLLEAVYFNFMGSIFV